MTRRIVLTVLVLITALLGIVAVPLGLITAGQDRRDFRDETVAVATALANVAEERLGDHSHGPALDGTIAQLQGGGDRVSIYDRTDARIAGTVTAAGATRGQVHAALAGTASASYPAGRLLIVAPVTRDGGGGTIGAIALSRSTEALDHRLAVLWGWLVCVSAAGLAAAALIAIGLARWVNRPLAALETAARQLGNGALDTRAAAGSGPSEVRRLAENFNTMAGRLQALLTGHQAMMADVSHQLRTPLAALRLRLDVLAQDSDTVVAGELAGAQEEIARLARMVNGLLAVARAENVTTPSVQVEVDTVIRDRAAAWRPAAEEREITLAAANLEPAAARLGEGQLEQIMDNLLANALDAVPPGGTVQAATSAARDSIRIVVADDGPGMSRQQLQTAFRRFASGTPGGTGLGLAIVDRLVTSNGGSAALSDTPGGGLTVTIELPGAPRDRGRRAGPPAS
ncbi:MAG TPA: HAMP domain-containing sensor histidine kinase [Streptosporangiaceae bacterium]|nr:HAMP domain-containing sensor histidine kinase [Streptosporangiaceae bacterium]